MYFYYTKNGKSFGSRYEALIEPEPCFLYFYDKEFINVDWTIEPTKTLPELYKDRAISIRNRYDYLVLAYSGGIDSTNILETFYHNNIPIDEIVTVGALSQDSYSGSDENHNGDLYYNVLPTCKEFNLPLTVLDYTNYFSNLSTFSLIRDYGPDWFKHCGSYYSPHNLLWRDLPKFLPKKTSKKATIIFGHDKPFFLYSNRPYFMFYDNCFNDYGDYQSWKGNYIRTNFYTDIDTIDLMKKQYHTIWNFYRSNVLTGKISNEIFFYKNNYANIANNLIYKLQRPLMFQSKKSVTNLLSARDKFLLRTTKNSDIYKMYREMVDKFSKENTVEFNAVRNKGRISFQSRKYYLTGE